MVTEDAGPSTKPAVYADKNTPYLVPGTRSVMLAELVLVVMLTLPRTATLFTETGCNTFVPQVNGFQYSNIGSPDKL